MRSPRWRWGTRRPRARRSSACARSPWPSHRGWLALTRGDLAACDAALEETKRECEQLGFVFAQYQVAFGMLMRAAHGGDRERTLAAMADVEQRLLTVPSPILAAGGGLALVHAKLRLGETVGDELRAALARAREAGFWGTGFIGRAEMRRLCDAALRHEVELGYVAELMRVYELPPGEHALLLPDWRWPVRVRVLGAIEIELDGRRVEFGRKRPAVPIALLTLLAAENGPVPIAKLTRALWPGYGGRAPRGTLDTAVYRLRKLLGSEAALEHSHGTLALARELCWTDVRALERLCERLDALGNEPDRAVADGEIDRLAACLQALDRGPLAAEGDPLALQRAAERLQRRVAAAKAQLAALRARPVTAVR
jgi:hypothetical protein